MYIEVMAQLTECKRYVLRRKKDKMFIGYDYGHYDLLNDAKMFKRKGDAKTSFTRVHQPWRHSMKLPTIDDYDVVEVHCEVRDEDTT
jgi:hypothetical protein